MFTSDCNQFVSMLEARTDLRLPQLDNENSLNFQELTSIKVNLDNLIIFLLNIKFFLFNLKN